MNPEHQAEAGRVLRLAYFTTEYPKVSHTFIRREILELERRGHRVTRLAVRGGGAAIADSADRDELLKTRHCLSTSRYRLLLTALRVVAAHPIRWMRAAAMAWRMSRVSERGVIRHIAYLIESCWLLRELSRERIEHLHVHFGTNSAAVARLTRCLGGPPYSMTIHGPDEFDAPRGFSLGQKIADAAFVVAISDFCAAQLRRWSEPRHWDKIHIVRCTVDERFFQERRSIDDSTTLVCIGRLAPQKGQLLLLDAVRRLADEGYQMRLVLAGDGEMRDDIEDRIAQLRLERHVAITGWIDEATVRQHVLSSLAVVQPSFAEGLPVVIMEALALGRPVISTAIAGIPELVGDGRNGWLIPAGNVEALVDAMREALDAPLEQLERMGEAGRRCVRDRHSLEGQIDVLERLFLERAGGPMATSRARTAHAAGRDVGHPVMAASGSDG